MQLLKLKLIKLFKFFPNFLKLSGPAFASQLKVCSQTFLSSYYYYSSETKFLTATPPRALTLQTRNSQHISELF